MRYPDGSHVIALFCLLSGYGPSQSTEAEVL